MHCEGCDKELTDFEATRKHAKTGHFIDLCNECFAPIAHEIPVVENYTLMTQQEMDTYEN